MVLFRRKLYHKSFYCSAINPSSERDRNDIALFEPTHEQGAGLVRYLQNRALNDELCAEMRTYLVRDRRTHELVGYFSIKAGFVSAEMSPDENGGIEFDATPAVELANFAINNVYRESHPSTKGSGEIIFRHFVIPIVKEAAKHIGIAVVYIYSLPEEDLIENYKRYGFRRLAIEDEKKLHHCIKPRYDRDCIFMFVRLSWFSSRIHHGILLFTD